VATVEQLQRRLTDLRDKEAKAAADLADAQRLAAEQDERDAKYATVQEAIRTAIADAKIVIPEGIKAVIAPATDDSFTVSIVPDGKATGNGNGHNQGSCNNENARPKLDIPDGQALFVVDNQGNYVQAENYTQACEVLGLACYKRGVSKGDSPSRVLLAFQADHPDRLVIK